MRGSSCVKYKGTRGRKQLPSSLTCIECIAKELTVDNAANVFDSS
jgi:hypothetical protein